MDLTRRQYEFLSKLIDLSREAHHPLHYSVVAERLHVSPMTAYDMLRLLEERGLVVSRYALPKGGGPGRSTILFSPTAKAMELITQVAGEAWDQEEWETVKERILQAVRHGKDSGYQDLLDDLLLRIPECRSHMVLAAEMTTAVLLTVNEMVGHRSKDDNVFQALRALGLPEELGLNALSGLMLGLSLAERANRSAVSRLLSYSRLYQDHLARLSADSRGRLTDFAQEVMRIMEA